MTDEIKASEFSRALFVAGSLRVVNYEGQGRGKQFINALELATADIVLTTYTVLAHDIYHQPDVTGAREHNLRHAKRYEVSLKNCKSTSNTFENLLSRPLSSFF